jgi:mono/diheme cytochrome c family protein
MPAAFFTRRLTVTYLLAVAAVVACAATQRGASDVTLANAKLFEQHCSSCHGKKGEGITAPAIMGPGALPTYPKDSNLANNPAFADPSELKLRELSRPAGAPKREPFNTAQDVFTYIHERMPMRAAGSLRPDEYWAILSFMLLAHGVNVPAGGVNSSNAGTVAITAP